MKECEKLFAIAYIKNGGNAYAAAIEAGYAPSTAKHAYQWLEEDDLPKYNGKKKHLLFKPYIKEEIEKQLKAIESEKVAEATEVMQYLTSVLRGEEQDEKPIVSIDGSVEKIKYTVQGNRLKAAELLIKVLGMANENLNLKLEPITFINDVRE